MDKVKCPICYTEVEERNFKETEVFESYIAFHEGVGTKLREYHKAFFKYFPFNVRGKLLDVGCGD